MNSTDMAPFHEDSFKSSKQEPQIYNCYLGPDGSTYFRTVPSSAPINVPAGNNVCGAIQVQQQGYASMQESPQVYPGMMYSTVPQYAPSAGYQQQPTMCMVVPAGYSPGGYSSGTYSPAYSPSYSMSPASSTFQYSPASTTISSPASGRSPSGSRASTPSSAAGSNHDSAPNGGVSISRKLELIWHGEFNKLFQQFPHRWSLVPVSDPNAMNKDDFHCCMDSAKVRFSCPICGNCWTSMKGRVYFLYALDQASGQGVVYFKLFGQKCQKCPDEDYVHSMWYPDEIVKVIANIYQKVGSSYYDFTAPVVRIDRRRGQPKKPHPLVGCQACEMNICKEEHNFR